MVLRSEAIDSSRQPQDLRLVVGSTTTTSILAAILLQLPDCSSTWVRREFSFQHSSFPVHADDHVGGIVI